MRKAGLIQRLGRDAVLSGVACLVIWLFAPVTTVCLLWRPRSGWEYTVISALHNPSLLASLFFFSLMVGFSLTTLLCFVLSRRMANEEDTEVAHIV